MNNPQPFSLSPTTTTKPPITTEHTTEHTTSPQTTETFTNENTQTPASTESSSTPSEIPPLEAPISSVLTTPSPQTQHNESPQNHNESPQSNIESPLNQNESPQHHNESPLNQNESPQNIEITHDQNQLTQSNITDNNHQISPSVKSPPAPRTSTSFTFISEPVQPPAISTTPIQQPKNPVSHLHIQTSLPPLTSPLSPRKSRRMRVQTPKAKEFSLHSTVKSAKLLPFDILLTPGQAVAKNRRLPKGYKFISVACLDADGNVPASKPKSATGVAKQLATIAVAPPVTKPTKAVAKKKEKPKPVDSREQIEAAERERAMREKAEKIMVLKKRLEILKAHAIQPIVNTPAPRPPPMQRLNSASRNFKTPRTLPPKSSASRISPIITTGFSTPTNNAMTPGGTIGTVTTADGRRSSRAVKTPKTYIEDTEPVKLSEPMRKLKDLITYLMKQKCSHFFNTPVDVVALNIPQYHTLIKEPMDLGTVKEKLESGVYENDVEECAFDVRLVFSNGKLFNPPENFVHQQAHQYSMMFEEKYVKLMNQIANKARTQNIAQEKKIAREKVKTPRTPKNKIAAQLNEIGELGALHDLKGSIESMIQNALNDLTPTGTTAAKKPPARRAPKQNLDKVPLTHQEKEKLKTDIMALPQNKLEPVLEMCTKDIPNDADNDEVEIDVDKLKVPTLRKLQAYVKKQQQLAKRRKTPTPKRKTPTPGRRKSPAVKRPGSGRPGSSRGVTPGGSMHMPSPPALESEPEALSVDSTPGFNMPQTDLSKQKPEIMQPRPLDGIMDSDSDSGGSDSDSSSDDDDDESAPRKKKRKVPLSEAPKILDQNSQLEVGDMGNTAGWGDIGSQDNQTSASGQNNLWSSYQNKEQQQRDMEGERKAREERLQQERARIDSEKMQRATDARRKQEEAAERMREERDASLRAQERKLEEEREAARRAREEQDTVDLGEQNVMMETFGF